MTHSASSRVPLDAPVTTGTVQLTVTVTSVRHDSDITLDVSQAVALSVH